MTWAGSNWDGITALHRRLAAAMLLSLLLHLALLAGLGPNPQKYSDNMLQVRLVGAPSAVPPAAERLLPETRVPAPPPAAPAARQLFQAPQTPREIARQPLLPLPDPMPPAGRAEIRFEIFSGKTGESLGGGVQRFETDDSDHYQLSFEEAPAVDGAAPGGGWKLEIRGQIISNSLRPTHYRRQGRLAEQLMLLGGGTAGGTAPEVSGAQEGRMPDGVPDRLSVLYQFMFSPPVDADGLLMLSDGEKFGTYTVHVLGMESVEVRSRGAVRALHLELSGSARADSTELWLAPEFRYLPVRMRYTDAGGNVTEQRAVSLAVQ